MAQRGIIETELADLLENGEARYKDPERLWIAKAFPERNDNLICAPVAIEGSLVVKTLMHHFEWGSNDAHDLRRSRRYPHAASFR